MQIFKKLKVSIDFSIVFSTIASFRSSAPKPHTNADFQIFLNVCPDFPPKIDIIFKKFWKNGKFSIKIIKQL